VQIFDDARPLSVEPAAIVPTAPPPDAPPAGFVVTVLPLGVVVVAGKDLVGSGRGVGRLSRGVGRSVRFGCSDRFGSADLVGALGTSFNCGCAALSRFASARSRFSAVSAPSAVLSGFFVSDRHAASDASATARVGTQKRRVYFDMRIPR
jgi:hypothetical protein